MTARGVEGLVRTHAWPTRGAGAPGSARHRHSNAPGERRGIVLLVVLLFLALLGVSLAAGAEIASGAHFVSGARADLARAQLAAEAAVRVAAFSWRAGDARGLAPLDQRAVGGPLRLDGASGGAIVRRLAGDAFLIAGDGRAGAARARAAALVHVLSVASLLPTFPGGLVAATPHVTGGEALVMGPTSPPPPWPGVVCDPGAADTLLQVFGPDPRPPVATDGGGPPSGLGPLSWDRLAVWADRQESGSIRLGPAVRDGACDRAASGNWGAPEDPTSPCAGWFPLVYAPGDLRVEGGAGQGVLVVRGDLVLGADARFFGPVLVGGAVRADAGAEVWGAVHARSAEWGGRVTYSACALLRALSASPGLGRPYRAGSRLWLPFDWP